MVTVKNTFLEIESEEEEDRVAARFSRQTSAPAGTSSRFCQDEEGSDNAPAVNHPQSRPEPRLKASSFRSAPAGGQGGESSGKASGIANMMSMLRMRRETSMAEPETEPVQPDEDSDSDGWSDPPIEQKKEPFIDYEKYPWLLMPSVQPAVTQQRKASQPLPANVTTVMMRNLPNKLRRKALLDEMDHAGFEGRYDFIYLPIDQTTGANRGYAFINFLENRDALSFQRKYEGSKLQNHNSNKVIIVTAAMLQGYSANYAHYAKARVSNGSLESRPLFLRQQDDMDEDLHDASNFKRGRCGKAMERACRRHKEQQPGPKPQFPARAFEAPQPHQLPPQPFARPQKEVAREPPSPPSPYMSMYAPEQFGIPLVPTQWPAQNVMMPQASPTSKASKFCPFCGEQANSKHSFCRYCGGSLADDGLSPASAASFPAAAPQHFLATRPQPKEVLPMFYMGAVEGA